MVARVPLIRPAGRALRRAAAPLPWRVRFWDGVARPSSGGVAGLFRLWRRGASMRAESEAAWAAYDGGDVVDVGAFHGWYAALLAPRARPGATFVLVEPDPSAVPTLMRTAGSLAETFPALRFCVVPRAAGDGSCVRPVYPYGPEGHPRFESADDPGAERSLSVDGLAAGLGVRPSLVKVDVEGAEVFVVRGAAGTLESARPTVMLETHPLWQPTGVEASDVTAPLRAAGYAAADLDVSVEVVRQLWRPS